MKRNKFSLSNYRLLTCKMGSLVPVNWFETLPGDTVQLATSALIRLSPLLAPIMHPVRVRFHHWFVPNRLIWEDWEDFITGGPDGLDDSEPPTINDTQIDEGTLPDYLGVPTGSYGHIVGWSALPVRAYNLIYNEHYRDQDLIPEVPISTASGVDSTTNQGLLNVAWEKDYFTTARPWTQKGATVTIPMTGNADVTPDFKTDRHPSFDGTGGGANIGFAGDGGGTCNWDGALNGNAIWNDPKLLADLTSGTGAINVEDLRLALSLQRYQEARARYGSRYVEYLRYLGVRPSDARLQNPEYLGGGRNVIQFSEVLKTGGEDTGDNEPIGTMKGHGVAAMRTRRTRRFFEEHGICMTLMSIVPKPIYTTGLHRSMIRYTKEDYFQKELQFIGEQEITNREIQATHSSPDDAFGYQARYDEYKWSPSTVHGNFRSTLNYWHMAREFQGDVALNQSFVTATPTDRVYADKNTDPVLVMAQNSVVARRQMSKFGTPRTM